MTPKRVALAGWLLGLACLLLPVWTVAEYRGVNGQDASVQRPSGTFGDFCGPALYALLHRNVDDFGEAHARDSDCSGRAGGPVAIGLLLLFAVAAPAAFASRDRVDAAS